MRNPNLKCLLCETNNSTKENSHIIPKFMGKEIFKTEKGNRGFVIGTNSAHLPPQITQDSPKESYILCPSCEQYISILETYIATRFHSRLWDKKFSQQFGTFNNNGGITWKVCNEIEPAVFRLFIYSIVWRCSISSVPLCKDFLLNKEEEERLRLSLLLCKYETQIELLSNISKHANEITLPEFLLFTAESFGNKTSNTLFVNPSIKNPYQLVLNNYRLILSFNVNETQRKFEFLNNINLKPIKVGFFPQKFWIELREQQMEMVMQRAAKNLKETGEMPFSLKK